VLGLAAVLALLGCQSPSATGPGADDPGDAEPPPRARVDPDPVEMRSSQAEAGLKPIYFDYDSFQLRADAQSALRDNAERIGQHPEWGVLQIEGHCDERGSDEYNLALGQQRARVVATYLVDLGVPKSRLETVSFGETRPAVPGHAETAWRYNRRSEIRAPSVQVSER
jgi:peptidoglycan-associated lipoprotein